MQTLVLACLSVLALAPSPDPMQQDLKQQDLKKRIEAVVREELATGDAETVSIAILAGGEMWWAQDWSARDGPSGPGEYRAASLATQLAAAGLAQLTQTKHVGLDDPLSKYVAGLSEEQGAVRVRELLAQTSGLPASADFLEARERAGKPCTPDELIAWLAEQRLDTRPGECRAFSNTNAILAGRIVEKVAGEPLTAWARQRLLEPAKLEHTGTGGKAPAFRDVAASLQEFDGATESEGRGARCFAARDMCTSAPDLARLARALARGPGLAPAAWKLLTAPAEASGPGLGFNLAPLEGATCLSFGGGAGGARVHAAWYPDYDVAIAVCAQSERTRVDRLERRVARAFLDLAEPELVDLELEQGQGSLYAGGFLIGCNRVTIERDGERLIAHFVDRPAFGLRYQGEHRFVSAADPEVRLIFAVEGKRAESFAFEEHGARSIALRVD